MALVAQAAEPDSAVADTSRTHRRRDADRPRKGHTHYHAATVVVPSAAAPAFRPRQTGVGTAVGQCFVCQRPVVETARTDDFFACDYGCGATTCHTPCAWTEFAREPTMTQLKRMCPACTRTLAIDKTQRAGGVKGVVVTCALLVSNWLLWPLIVLLATPIVVGYVSKIVMWTWALALSQTSGGALPAPIWRHTFEIVGADGVRNATYGLTFDAVHWLIGVAVSLVAILVLAPAYVVWRVLKWSCGRVFQRARYQLHKR